MLQSTVYHYNYEASLIGHTQNIIFFKWLKQAYWNVYISVSIVVFTSNKDNVCDLLSKVR